MTDQARLFEGARFQESEDLTDRRRAEARRIATVHAKHGHGADGQTCRGCVHLIHKRGVQKSFLKCELYRSDGYDGTDWRAKWPACGAYTATPADSVTDGSSRTSRRPRVPVAATPGGGGS